MPTGTMVYHNELHMNLIVCQVDTNGKIICVNPNIFNNNMFQVIVADESILTKGWRTSYN